MYGTSAVALKLLDVTQDDPSEEYSTKSVLPIEWRLCAARPTALAGNDVDELRSTVMVYVLAPDALQKVCVRMSAILSTSYPLKEVDAVRVP
jgi:hypothetical protein